MSAPSPPEAPDAEASPWRFFAWLFAVSAPFWILGPAGERALGLPPEPKVAESERKIEIPLPSDRDMDRMMSFLEQAWRRLVEMANRVQKDVSGKI